MRADPAEERFMLLRALGLCLQLITQLLSHHFRDECVY